MDSFALADRQWKEAFSPCSKRASGRRGSQKPLFLEGREAGRADALGLVLLPNLPVEHHGPPHREGGPLVGRPEIVVVERTPCSLRITDRVAELVGERARCYFTEGDPYGKESFDTEKWRARGGPHRRYPCDGRHPRTGGDDNRCRPYL